MDRYAASTFGSDIYGGDLFVAVSQTSSLSGFAELSVEVPQVTLEVEG